MYKLKFHFVNGSCFKCFCLGYILLTVHILSFWFTNEIPKTFENYGRLKALHKTSLNFPSTVDYNYRLLKVGYVNQVIHSLSYKRIWTISKFRPSFFWKVLIKFLIFSARRRLTLCFEKEWLLNSFIIFSTNCIYFRTILSTKKQKGQLIFMN